MSEMPGIEITYMDREAIEWDFLPNREVGKANSCCGGVKNYVVKYLYLRFSSLPLEDFVNAYGTPTYVYFYWVGHRLDRCDLEIAYESLGMVLRSTLECGHAKNRDRTLSVNLDIQANAPIDGISLRPISGEDYLLIQRPENSLDWKDYGQYVIVIHPE